MLFDIDIEVGGEKLTVQNVDVKDDGTFNTCACNGNNQQKRVDGVWTPTYLILSVGDNTVGACGDAGACKTDQEIDKGQMYIFEQWADDVMLNDRHANFNTASGVMKFAFTGDGNDTVEFVDAQGTTTVKFKAHEDKAAETVAQPGAAPTAAEPTTTPETKVEEVEAPVVEGSTSGTQTTGEAGTNSSSQPTTQQEQSAGSSGETTGSVSAAPAGGPTTADGKPVSENSTGVLVGVYEGNEW
ncbi:hypothetical protein AOV_04970 [Anaplasma ovis str. Haibei]|uniref:Uncharacterized protein n=1 Tax=Anaplasma ovis str. Haibei TaxID=1248439 RepID=A0A2Z2LCF3_9RICK|nr:hypothetical protein [Anaplasma ovis]ASI48083.1 hypothetical protein AOV_04970 [Anaplasma ovis str. Haibei]